MLATWQQVGEVSPGFGPPSLACEHRATGVSISNDFFVHILLDACSPDISVWAFCIG